MAEYDEVRAKLDAASSALFQRDSSVRSVGITRGPRGYHFHAVRNATVLTTFSATASFDGVEVSYSNAFEDPHRMHLVAESARASSVRERGKHRPLVCGLEVQNFDHDVRKGYAGLGMLNVGTLGCFVRLDSGAIAMLSNNHVLVSSNVGEVDKDRIYQAGATKEQSSLHVGTLHRFQSLKGSPAGTLPGDPALQYNEVDAAVAVLLEEQAVTRQQWLPEHNAVPNIAGTILPEPEHEVFKVGRTTGLTYGVVEDVDVTIGPISYDGVDGGVWLKGCFSVRGVDGGLFSDHGDSGSAIVHRRTGKLLGLLFAGNGTHTYACSIGSIEELLRCRVL